MRAKFCCAAQLHLQGTSGLEHAVRILPTADREVAAREDRQRYRSGFQYHVGALVLSPRRP